MDEDAIALFKNKILHLWPCGYPVRRAMEIHESNLKYVTKIYVKTVLIYNCETWGCLNVW